MKNTTLIFYTPSDMLFLHNFYPHTPHTHFGTFMCSLCYYDSISSINIIISNLHCINYFLWWSAMYNIIARLSHNIRKIILEALLSWNITKNKIENCIFCFLTRWAHTLKSRPWLLKYTGINGRYIFLLHTSLLC